MKKLSFILLCCFFAWGTVAQNKQFTIEEATLGLRTSLAAKTIKQLQWIPEMDAYSFVTEDMKNPAFVQVRLPKQTTDTIIDLKTLVLQDSSLAKLNAMPNIKWLGPTFSYFRFRDNLYSLTKNGEQWHVKVWMPLEKEAENLSFEKEKKQFAYTIGNNLYWTNDKLKTFIVTSDSNKGIVNGQSVHQNEFGIDGGIFFSPKGNLLAYYRMDETMVEDYPIIDWSVTPAVNHNKKYPMAGSISHHVTLGVFNPKTQQSVFMKTGLPADHYLTCVSWSPDEKYIYIAILNRDQNHLWLNQYDASTGNFLQTLFEEKDEKYVQPQHSLTFLPGKNEEFIWWSQRDGYMHLYRYNTKGKLLNQVTKGNWVVNSLLGMNKDTKQLIIASSEESPMSKNIYAVSWENGKRKRVDEAFGVHNATASESGRYILDVYSNPETPKNTEVRATNGKWKEVLKSSENTLISFQRPQIKDLTLKASDGTDLFGRMILPVPFDSTKKYPVIVYLYNGPNVQLLNNAFPASGNLWYEFMAQKGYIVFVMDGRGSSNRGLKFEQVTFRHLGTVEMEDQLKGVDYLKSLSFVDSNRLGVHGWSYGGFMTTSLMLRHPGIFKVGVAGGPVIDWRMYEIMYTERYMDTPQQNPEGYEEANLLTKTQNLKGKLLMIHGAQDGVVVWQHSIKFLKSCVDQGIQMDYFVYPGHEHNVLGKDRIHLMQKITDYFDAFL